MLLQEVDDDEARAPRAEDLGDVSEFPMVDGAELLERSTEGCDVTELPMAEEDA